jgi:hypothetical protein
MVLCMVCFLNPGEIGLRREYHALYYGQATTALLGLRVVIFEWAHNLKRVTADFLRAMMIPFTSEPT